MLDQLSDQELALLQATKASENAMTLPELAENAETSPQQALPTLISLISRGILEPYYEEWNTRFFFPDNTYAQSVYDAIYGEETKV